MLLEESDTKEYIVYSGKASIKGDHVKVEVSTNTEDCSDNDIDMSDDYSVSEDVNIQFATPTNKVKYSKVQTNDIKKGTHKKGSSKYYLDNPQDKVLLEGYSFEEKIIKGKPCHYFSKDGYKYRRKEKKPSGVSCFVCMANGCKAKLNTKYNINDDTQEPTIYRVPLETDHTHTVEKVDVLIREAKKRLRRSIEENPAITLLSAYNEVVKDIREEIGEEVNLLEQFNQKMLSYKSLSSTLYRWRDLAFSFTT